jgi:hypothetical protein
MSHVDPALRRFQRHQSYPRFLWGRGLFAVLVLCVTRDERNSPPAFASCAAFVAAKSFESATAFNAAFALLLNLFFSFAISQFLFNS